MEWMGKSNPFARSVDLGRLPQTPKGLLVLAAAMGDIVDLSFATMEERGWNTHVQQEVEDDYI
jgi:hypothetical protein